MQYSYQRWAKEIPNLEGTTCPACMSYTVYVDKQDIIQNIKEKNTNFLMASFYITCPICQHKWTFITPGRALGVSERDFE